jgi:hypothetical protein
MEFRVSDVTDAAQHPSRPSAGIALGETKAPTSTVRKPASTSLSTKAIRLATLTGVFSFCRPSRGPISMMRT